MNDPLRNTPPVLDYAGQEHDARQEHVGLMWCLGRLAIPVLVLIGIAFIVVGVLDRSNLVIAGSIIIGSVLITDAIRSRP